MECDVVVYDITQDAEQVDEASWAITALHAELERIDKPKIFILVSTVMTWAKSKLAEAVSSFQISNNGNFIFILLKGRSRDTIH